MGQESGLIPKSPNYVNPFLAADGDRRVSLMVSFFFFFFFFGVPQLYLWGSPLLGEIFAYVTVF